MSLVGLLVAEKITGYLTDLLLPGTKRMVVSGVIRSLTPSQLQGITANQLLSQFKLAGYGVRRQWFLQQTKYHKTARVFTERQTSLPSEGRLLARDMPIAPVNIQTKYSYQVEMSVLGYTETSPSSIRDKDEWGTQKYWFGSDKLLTKSQVLKGFEAKFRTGTMAEVHADWATLKFKKASKRGPII